MNFGLIGAAGYIAPKHMQAIHETGNQLVAAVDPHDCVGRLDNHFPEARFFTEIERFDRYLEKCRRGTEDQHVEYVSVCSPNYLHDAHCRLALRVKAHAICEKPLVTSPWNLDALERLEEEHDRRVYNILQLRLVPSVLEFKHRLETCSTQERAEVSLTYITRRGRWYDSSWKGNHEKSGGVAMNIGIHFFDLLLWLFGDVDCSQVHVRQPRKMAGLLELERARVKWFLSTDGEDIPEHVSAHGGYAYRSMTYNDQELELSGGFAELHTRVYQEILAGRGTGIHDARPAIELVFGLNQADVTDDYHNAHPLVRQAVKSTVAFSQRIPGKAA